MGMRLGDARWWRWEKPPSAADRVHGMAALKARLRFWRALFRHEMLRVTQWRDNMALIHLGIDANERDKVRERWYLRHPPVLAADFGLLPHWTDDVATACAVVAALFFRSKEVG